MAVSCRLLLFRRDLRVVDNTALAGCVSDARASRSHVVPVFVYDAIQADPTRNAYFSEPAFRFLNAALAELDAHLRARPYGETLSASLLRVAVARARDEYDPDEEIDHVRASLPTSAEVTAVYWNADVTPYARHRDSKLATALARRGIAPRATEDYTLVPEARALRAEPYKVFGAFYARRRELATRIPRPQPTEDAVGDVKPDAYADGPRARALDKLTRVKREHLYVDYARTRNDLADENGTTHLSAFLKFGSVSIREAFWTFVETFGLDHAVARELLFREFYYALARASPHSLRGMVPSGRKRSAARAENRAYEERFDAIRWRKSDDTPESQAAWRAWVEGRTGVPLVDAGMRQLNATGFMHNRTRMVVAMFLTKDLFMDWREGERYFATHLVDYDPVQNSAGWQWSASVGTDAAPYFRIFNPYLQQQRFDPNAEYVKRWVPELRNVPLSAIRDWERRHRRQSGKTAYPAPIVASHKDAAARARAEFVRVLQATASESRAQYSAGM